MRCSFKWHFKTGGLYCYLESPKGGGRSAVGLVAKDPLGGWYAGLLIFPFKGTKNFRTQSDAKTYIEKECKHVFKGR